MQMTIYIFHSFSFSCLPFHQVWKKSIHKFWRYGTTKILTEASKHARTRVHAYAHLDSTHGWQRHKNSKHLLPKKVLTVILVNLYYHRHFWICSGLLSLSSFYRSVTLKSQMAWAFSIIITNNKMMWINMPASTLLCWTLTDSHACDPLQQKFLCRPRFPHVSVWGNVNL